MWQVCVTVTRGCTHVCAEQETNLAENVRHCTTNARQCRHSRRVWGPQQVSTQNIKHNILLKALGWRAHRVDYSVAERRKRLLQRIFFDGVQVRNSSSDVHFLFRGWNQKFDVEKARAVNIRRTTLGFYISDICWKGGGIRTAFICDFEIDESRATVKWQL